MEHSVIDIEDLNVIKKMANEHFYNNGIPNTHKLYKPFMDARQNLHKSLQSVMHYFSDYGDFKCSNGCGNPIPYGKDRIGEVWAACYLGSRKQESPQIYAHINTHNNSIDVGFSFGFHKDTSKMRKQGRLLADYLKKNPSAYHSLKKVGFAAYMGNWEDTLKISFEEWLEHIQIDPATCRVVKSFHDVITEEKLQETISYLIFFINGLSSQYLNTRSNFKPKKAKTKSERIKEYVRNLDLGEKGEEFVFKLEKKKLIQRGIKDTYPQWESKKSDNSGYDIVSLDENGEEIYIEVKTTSMSKENPLSSIFYMSANEYKVMQDNRERYHIFRVYNIDGDAEYDIYSMKDFNVNPDNYKVTILCT